MMNFTKLSSFERFLPSATRTRLEDRRLLAAWSVPADDDTMVAKTRKVRKLRSSEVAWLVEQLATTEQSGISLYRALGMIAKLRGSSPVGIKTAAVQEAMSEGATLSVAVNRIIPEAGPLVAALVAAGEASGNLGEALKKAHSLQSARLKMRRKVRSAMFYPVTVLVVAVVLVTVLVTLVVPKFKDIYASTGGELPALTQFVLNLSARAPLFIAVMGALVAGVIAVITRARTDAGLRMKMHRVRLRIPVFGNLLAKGAIARIAATMASMLSAGVESLQALEYAAETAGSEPHRLALLDVRQRVGDGATFAEAFANAQLFPELMVQLAQVGEETGSLPMLLTRYSVTAGEELENSADAVTQMIEPMLMVVIGGVVGVFLMALYLPILNLGQTISGG
jgi:type IV pilus assembly protein PilC